jgi:molybdopterin molybdotransferase
MHSGSHRVGLEKALRTIKRSVHPLEPEQVPVVEALGRILRQDVVSATDYPTATVSSVDGYCLSAASTSNATISEPVTLKVKGSIAAGPVRVGSLGEGECARIMTGAVLPPGADAVISLEEAEHAGGTVGIRRPVNVGNLVRLKGGIIRVGEVVLQQGEPITARHLAVLAALGCGQVSVSRRPAVGLLVTGDEIVECGEAPYPGGVGNSNGTMLSGLLQEWGIHVENARIVADREYDLAGAIEHLAGNDIVVISGGSGPGEHDLVAGALETVGAEVVIRGLRMRPGRHMLVARRGECICFCLPGNPVACFTLFHLIVMPALLAMMGYRKSYPMVVRGRWAGPDVRSPSDAVILLASMRPDLAVEPVEYRGSGDVLSIARADCLVSVPGGVSGVVSGQTVEVFRLGMT